MQNVGWGGHTNKYCVEADAITLLVTYCFHMLAHVYHSLFVHMTHILRIITAGAQNVTELYSKYDVSSWRVRQSVEMVDKFGGKLDKIEDFFFIVSRVLTKLDEYGLLMLPE